jgi:organic radical activating enzyme
MKKRKLLKGSYDLYITNACNLHCTGCSVLDYGGDYDKKGKITIPYLKLEDVKDIIENFNRLDLCVEELKVLGGEPTTHKELREITEYLVENNDCYEKLSIVTNGLNFSNNIIDIMKSYDRIIISVYTELGRIDSELTRSNVYKELIKNSTIDFWQQDTFVRFGEKWENVEYDQWSNWNNCYQKDKCVSLSKEGIYRCTILMNERSEGVDWSNDKDIINYVHRDEPLDRCKTCYWPAREERWFSKMWKTDLKNYKKGLEIIKTVNIHEKDNIDNTTILDRSD